MMGGFLGCFFYLGFKVCIVLVWVLRIRLIIWRYDFVEEGILKLGYDVIWKWIIFRFFFDWGKK